MTRASALPGTPASEGATSTTPARDAENSVLYFAFARKLR